MVKDHTFLNESQCKTVDFNHSFKEPRPTFLDFFSIFFFSKSHRNYGDILPGFGTWSKSIISMVKTFAVWGQTNTVLRNTEISNFC